MAASLGIAVGTLRKALADLTERGLLERIQGSGNYVRARADLPGVYAFFRLERLAGGGLPSAEILSVDLMDKPDDLPSFGASMRATESAACAGSTAWRRRSRKSGSTARGPNASIRMRFPSRSTCTTGWRSAFRSCGRRIGCPSAPRRTGRPESSGLARAMPPASSNAWLGPATAASAEYSRSWFDPAVAHYVSRFR